MGVGNYGLRHHSKGKKKDHDFDMERGVSTGRDTAGVELQDLEPVVTAGGSYESQRALV